MCKPRAVAAGNWDVKRKVGELGKGKKKKNQYSDKHYFCFSLMNSCF